MAGTAPLGDWLLWGGLQGKNKLFKQLKPSVDNIRNQ